MDYGSGQKAATHGGMKTDARKQSTKTFADDAKHDVGPTVTGKQSHCGTRTAQGSNANVVGTRAKKAY